MPKKRADLQVVAYRIDAAIRTGRAAALPIYQTGTEAAGLGRNPAVLVLLESLRIRLPAVTATARRRYEARYERPWYNRTTIPPSILNSRYVPVTEKSPDYEWLIRASRKERQEIGVVLTSRGWRRRIYEVVEDLSHGLRQAAHVKFGYADDIELLERMRLSLRDQLRKDELGIAKLNRQQRELIGLTSMQIGLRLAEIDRIYHDRSARESRLHAYVRMSNIQLFFLADSLATFTASIRRMRRPDVEAIRDYLRGLFSDLSLFTSKEIRQHRLNAQALIRRAAENLPSVETKEIVRLLTMAVEHLTRASSVLSGWSDSLSEEEKRDA